MGERVQLQAHLDLTQMGVGVILDIEAKEDGVAKAALVRFEGGPRAGLWYSVGSLEYEAPPPSVLTGPKVPPSPQLDPETYLGFAVQAPRRPVTPRGEARAGRDSSRATSKPQAEPPLDEEVDLLYYSLLGRLNLRDLHPLKQMDTAPWNQRLQAFLKLGPGRVSGEVALLLRGRGADARGLTAWLSAVWRTYPGRVEPIMAEVRAALEARPLWEWRVGASWPEWLYRAPWDELEEAPRKPTLLESQLVLRGWLFPGERMRALLAQLEAGVPGVESEREALSWVQERLRALGWWRPLEVRPIEPAFLSWSDLRASLNEVVPLSTLERLESLLKGAQRAGIVRSRAEAAAWARAWIQVWVAERSPELPSAELPQRLRAWDLIQRGWLLHPIRIRAFLVKEGRTRERREPSYMGSPLAWAYDQLDALGWLRPRRPSLEPIRLEALSCTPPAARAGALLAALQQARSAGVVRDEEEIEHYARAWLEEDQARRLSEALEREDLGEALGALGLAGS